MGKIEFHRSPTLEDPQPICNLLSHYTELSKTRVKIAMQKGAVWVKPAVGMERRIRRANAHFQLGDRVSLYYDPKVLSVDPPTAKCLIDFGRFSAWFKPSGLLSQGSKWGDHCSLLRQIEVFFSPRRPLFLVHRLDREASGVVLIAHSKDAAARLSALFREGRVKKSYWAEVKGKPAEIGVNQKISLPLDGKPAQSTYTVMAHDPSQAVSLVVVSIETGRKHQIRRHFEQIGHPVIGDPIYGKGNKNTDGLQLTACALSFVCPFKGEIIRVALGASDIPIKGAVTLTE